MSTQITPHGLRALGLALIAGVTVCAPAHAHGGGHFGAVSHGGFGFHGGFHFNRGFGFRGGCFRGGFGWWGCPQWSINSSMCGTAPIDTEEIYEPPPVSGLVKYF
jgi:hypothetical protein